MNKEKKVLGIIAIILGVIALLGSWVPIINNISFIFAVIALILGLIGLFVNKKNPKTLSIVGTSLAAVSIAIVLVTQSMYSSALKQASNTVESVASSVSSSMSQSASEAEASFTWTKEQFDALTIGDTFTGAGGVNYDTVIAEHGTPTDQTESETGGYSARYVTYSVFTTDNFKSISLTFVKQEDGSYLLSTKTSNGLE